MDFDDIGEYREQDRGAMDDEEEGQDPGVAGGAEGELADPLAAGEAPKKQANRRVFKIERFLEDDSGILALFKKFTMQPETVDGLRGTAGHEVEDLKKIMGQYQSWHLNHYPLYTFDHFTDRVRRFGQTGPQRDDVRAYMGKLRRHYKGEELLEELREAPKLVPEEQDGQANYTLFKQMADQKNPASVPGSSSKKPMTFNNGGSQQSFGLHEPADIPQDP